jgi:hypothetical protein
MKKKVIIIIFLFIIIIGSSSLIVFLLINQDMDQIPGNGDEPPPEPTPPPYEKIVLSQFLFPLDKVFKMDQPAVRQSRLWAIGNNTSQWHSHFIVPYPNYFHHGHYPATSKYYVYMDRYLPMTISNDCYLTLSTINLNNNDTVDDTLIVRDVSAWFHLSYYIRFNLGHCCINYSLVQQYLNSTPINFFNRTTAEKAIFIPGNTTVGYSHNHYATDLLVQDDTHKNFEGLNYPPYSIGIDNIPNPYYYFTEEVQNEIDFYYNDQYEHMKLSGQYIESRINSTYDIIVPNTLYGNWFYYNGPFALNDTHFIGTPYAFEAGVLNIMHINSTDRESFYTDGTTHFSKNMTGVFHDAIWVNVQEYKRLGTNYMYPRMGDNRTYGIFEFKEFYGSERTGTWYLKYNLDVNNASYTWDDVLLLEYFDSFSAAQGPYTSNNFTYRRVFDLMH